MTQTGSRRFAGEAAASEEARISIQTSGVVSEDRVPGNYHWRQVLDSMVRSGLAGGLAGCAVSSI